MKNLVIIFFLLMLSQKEYSQNQSVNGTPCGFSLNDSLVTSGVGVLDSVLFYLGNDKLLPSSYPHIDKLYLFLLRNKGLVLEVANHTDSRGSGQMCYSLSQSRAKTIVDYLISKGIPADRLVAKGYSDHKPYEEIDANCNIIKTYSQAYIDKLKSKEEKEMAYQKCRRTTLKILRNNYVAKPQSIGK